MSALSGKRFWLIVALIAVVKVVLLFWSAHPFDFWTFVVPFERSVRYGWPLFDHWNKGGLLLWLWYPMYALYLVILQLSSVVSNLPLLHFLMKTPFLFGDLVIGAVLYKAALSLSKKTDIARTVFLLWFANPFVYQIYGIHGHYEILTALAVTLLIYGLVVDKVFPVILGMIIGVQIKYFLILFAPLLACYYWSENRYRDLKKLIVGMAAGLAASYIYLLSYPELVNKLIGSIFGLATRQPTVGSAYYSLSIFNPVTIFYHWLNPKLGTTFLSKSEWQAASVGLLIFMLAVLFLIILRVVQVYLGRKYPKPVLLKDILFIIVSLLIFLPGSQLHYLIWLCPILLLLSIRDRILLWPYSILSLSAFLLSFKSEYGPRTFFADVASYFSPITISDTSHGFYWSFLILVSLVVILCWVIKDNYVGAGKRKKVVFHHRYLWIAFFAMWMIVLFTFAQAAVYYFVLGESNQRLAFSGGLPPGLVVGRYQAEGISGGVISFQAEQNGLMVLSGLQRLSSEERGRFSASVLVKNTERAEQLLPLLGAAKLNGCSNGLVGEDIFDYRDKTFNIGVNYDISCVLAGRNQLDIGLSGEDISSGDLVLYIVSKSDDYVYSPDSTRFVERLSVLGIGYLVLLIILIRHLFAPHLKSKDEEDS